MSVLSTKDRIVFVNDLQLNQNYKNKFITLSQNYSNVIFFTQQEVDSKILDNQLDSRDPDTSKTIYNIYKNGIAYNTITGIDKQHQVVNLGENVNIKISINEYGLIGIQTLSLIQNIRFVAFYDYLEIKELRKNRLDSEFLQIIEGTHTQYNIDPISYDDISPKYNHNKVYLYLLLTPKNQSDLNDLPVKDIYIPTNANINLDNENNLENNIICFAKDSNTLCVFYPLVISDFSNSWDLTFGYPYSAQENYTYTLTRDVIEQTYQRSEHPVNYGASIEDPFEIPADFIKDENGICKINTKINFAFNHFRLVYYNDNESKLYLDNTYKHIVDKEYPEGDLLSISQLKFLLVPVFKGKDWRGHSQNGIPTFESNTDINLQPIKNLLSSINNANQDVQLGQVKISVIGKPDLPSLVCKLVKPQGYDYLVLKPIDLDKQYNSQTTDHEFIKRSNEWYIDFYTNGTLKDFNFNAYISYDSNNTNYIPLNYVDSVNNNKTYKLLENLTIIDNCVMNNSNETACFYTFGYSTSTVTDDPLKIKLTYDNFISYAQQWTKFDIITNTKNNPKTVEDDCYIITKYNIHVVDSNIEFFLNGEEVNTNNLNKMAFLELETVECQAVDSRYEENGYHIYRIKGYDVLSENTTNSGRKSYYKIVILD